MAARPRFFSLLRFLFPIVSNICRLRIELLRASDEATSAQGKMELKRHSKGYFPSHFSSARSGCPKDKSAEHRGFFIMDADGASTVTKFFGPTTVDVKPVVPFSEVAKTL